ncbi:TATA-box-binding protein-like isoform X2 [Acanthopagrus latus]|uniref:TATA-box-binding protein-like isoform X2 n=1 Tax=Acanthopagrus latus TaxID=8177 RepID=UPI00187CA603|nr:TATA-box-binding protein-like isoform X2 [Acanthopagrus latus]
MAESAPEMSFDIFIVEDSSSSKTEQKEVKTEQKEVKTEQKEVKTEQKEVKTEQKEVKEEFFSALPDELLLFEEDTGDSSSLNYNSQNATAAALGASSMPAQEASSVPRPTSAMPETERPQILNVMSTMNLGCCLDLDFIAHRAWNVEYKPNKFFKGLVMRIREPRTTAVVYKSGKIMCTGTKSVQQARLGARKCARKVQKLGFPVRPLNFKIQTMTAKWKIFPLHLQRFSQHQNCSYDPELFPGLIYEVSPGITATIFSSGSICLSGRDTPVSHTAHIGCYVTITCTYPIVEVGKNIDQCIATYFFLIQYRFRKSYESIQACSGPTTRCPSPDASRSPPPAAGSVSPATSLEGRRLTRCRNTVGAAEEGSRCLSALSQTVNSQQPVSPWPLHRAPAGSSPPGREGGSDRMCAHLKCPVVPSQCWKGSARQKVVTAAMWWLHGWLGSGQGGQ